MKNRFVFPFMMFHWPISCDEFNLFFSPLTYNTTPSEDFMSSLALVLVGYFPTLSLSSCSTDKVHSGLKGHSMEKAHNSQSCWESSLNFKVSFPEF